MQAEITPYVKLFSSLRTASGKDKFPAATLHRAPHKPLLLLSVLDLAAQGSLPTNLILLSPELGDIFATYWKLVMPADRSANLSLPFFHLKSDGFWHLVPQEGKAAILEAIRQIAGMAQLRETVIGAQLDEQLYSLICMEETRNVLRATIIDKYFHPDVRPALMEQGNINLVAFQYSQTLLQHARIHNKPAISDGEGEQKPAVRDQGFRRAIVTAYDHRCVLCGIRLLTLEGQTAANAAHIVPWSLTHNDDPRNGLCLCRLCHWVFDVGLAGITTTYRVKLSKQMGLSGNITGYLSTLDNRPIFEPVEAFFNPDPEALDWHLDQVFLKETMKI